MLRECLRVLKPGGRLELCVIHTPEHLSRADVLRAARLGPSEVAARRPPGGLARAAGFDMVTSRDVTEEFEALCRMILSGRAGAEAELRRAEGDEGFEVEQEKKRSMLEGIAEGLLLRSWVSARRPPAPDRGAPP